MAASTRTLETVLAGSPHHRELIQQGYMPSFTRDGITYLEAPGGADFGGTGNKGVRA